jgi:hypothetical protein
MLDQAQDLKKEIVDEVYRDIDQSPHSIEVYQKRPFTMVHLRVIIPKRNCMVSAIGFSKVMAPDVWDEERGEKIAIRKARRQIARRLVSEQFPGQQITVHPEDDHPRQIPLYTTRRKLRQQVMANSEVKSGLALDDGGPSLAMKDLESLSSLETRIEATKTFMDQHRTVAVPE